MFLPSPRRKKNPNQIKISNRGKSTARYPHAAIKSGAIEPGTEVETTVITDALRRIGMDELATVTEIAAARNERAERVLDLEVPNAAVAREEAETIATTATVVTEKETENIRVANGMISETWIDGMTEGSRRTIAILRPIRTIGPETIAIATTTIGGPGWEAEEGLHLRCSAEKETFGATPTITEVLLPGTVAGIFTALPDAIPATEAIEALRTRTAEGLRLGAIGEPIAPALDAELDSIIQTRNE
jgi:hypothetical protein